MKRILLFAALCATVLFTNCKKDKTAADLIVGKWNVTKLIADSEDILNGDPDYSTTMVLEFTKTGTVVFDISGTDYTTTPPEVENLTVAGTYSINGDDQLSMNLNAFGDMLKADGKAVITKDKILFTNDSIPSDFIELLEATKQ